MKALDILESFLKGNCYIIDKEVIEAIDELKALENRSCNGCIYMGKSNCINCLSCSRQYTDNWRNK